MILKMKTSRFMGQSKWEPSMQNNLNVCYNSHSFIVIKFAYGLSVHQQECLAINVSTNLGNLKQFQLFIMEDFPHVRSQGHREPFYINLYVPKGTVQVTDRVILCFHLLPPHKVGPVPWQRAVCLSVHPSVTLKLGAGQYICKCECKNCEIQSPDSFPWAEFRDGWL